MYMVDHDIVLIADIATPTNWTRHRGPFAYIYINMCVYIYMYIYIHMESYCHSSLNTAAIYKASLFMQDVM